MTLQDLRLTIRHIVLLGVHLSSNVSDEVLITGIRDYLLI